MSNNRRRAFPLISSIQYRFLAVSLVYSFVIVCFFVIVVFGPDMVEMRNKALSMEVRSSAAGRVLVKHSWVWVAVFSLVLVLGLHSFRMFLRVIGPMYRFRWAFQELENGKLSPVKTRKRDYLRTEEEALNTMIMALAGKLGEIKEASVEAFKSMTALEQTVKEGKKWGETQIDLLRTHREHLERLAASVQGFRLEDETEK